MGSSLWHNAFLAEKDLLDAGNVKVFTL